MDAISTLGLITGAATGVANLTSNDAERQQAYQLELMKRQNDYNRAAAERQMAMQKEMYEYTGFGGKVRQLKEAGLNPGLIYGMGSAGGGVTGNTSAAQTGLGSAPNTAASRATKLQSIGMGLQLAKLQSEIEVNKSVAEANRSNAALNVEKTESEPYNRHLTIAEEGLKIMEKAYQEHTLEARVGTAKAVMSNMLLESWVKQSGIDLNKAQADEITQRIVQSAERFNYDLEKVKAETLKIVRETKNINLTGSEAKIMDIVGRLLPGLLAAIKK